MHIQPDKNKDDKVLFGLQEIWELELQLSVIFPPFLILLIITLTNDTPGKWHSGKSFGGVILFSQAVYKAVVTHLWALPMSKIFLPKTEIKRQNWVPKNLKKKPDDKTQNIVSII